MTTIKFPNDIQQKPTLDDLDEILVADSDNGGIARKGTIGALKKAAQSEALAIIRELTEQNGVLIEAQAAPALEAEVTSGKTQLASAIAAKGIEVSANEPLHMLANKVRDIQTQKITIDGGEFYVNNLLGKTIYNLFEVAADIKSRYISSGKYAGAIIAQYYKGYATLNLLAYGGGFVACETSDGDFYANDGINTPIDVHTWHDDESVKFDRYVVFLYLKSDFAFTSTDSGLCPREIMVVGDCADIKINFNRLVNIYVPSEFGTLNNFQLSGNDTPEGMWSGIQLWENYTAHSSGSIFKNDTNRLLFIEFANLKTVSGGNIIHNERNQGFAALNALSLPSLEELTGGYILYSTQGSFAEFTEIFLPALKKMSGGSILRITNTTNFFPKLSSLSLPSLEELSGGEILYNLNSSISFGSLSTISLPKLKVINGGIVMNSGFKQFTSLTSISMPSLEEISNGGILYTVATGSPFPALKSLHLPSLKKIGGLDNNSYVVLARSGCSLEEIYMPALRTIEYMKNQNRDCPLSAKRVYAPMLESGILPIIGTASYGYTSIIYLLAGCKGKPTEELWLGAENSPSEFELEIGDKEYIEAGLAPRWQPRMMITLKGLTVITSACVALKILDRLADNSDGDTITINIGTNLLNKILADATYAPYVAAAQAKNYTIV